MAQPDEGHTTTVLVARYAKQSAKNLTAKYKSLVDGDENQSAILRTAR
jgi:hypothetical protein